MTHVVEHMHSKHKALSSTSGTTQKTKEGKKEEGYIFFSMCIYAYLFGF
jgi:hypothetical protein